MISEAAPEYTTQQTNQKNLQTKQNEKPTPLPVNFENIPQEIKEAGARWNAWKYIWKDDEKKWAKIPFQKNGQQWAKSNDPTTWMTYDQAVALYKTGYFDGVGLYMGGNLEDGFDNLTGLDWDHTPTFGISDDEILGIRSYAETSPSGDGARCFCLLDGLPWKRYKEGKGACREVYDKTSNRFLTITGHHIEGSPEDIRQADPDGFNEFFRHFPKPNGRKKQEPHTPLKNDEVLKKARKSPKFSSLWKGDISDYTSSDDGDPDHSAADMALCNILAAASNRDPDMIDTLFRKSDLMRPKWDEYRGEFTYGQITIEAAIKRDEESSPFQELKPRVIADDIKNLKLRLNLPEEHFISKYVSFCSEKTDAYPDYHYAAAIALLSIAADRNLVLPVEHEMNDLYTNIWQIILGRSSFSRKSTALNIASIILGAYNPAFKAMADSITPERFVEALEEHPRCYHIRDESGAIFSDLNKKKYMEGLRDYLCLAYDGRPITRENKARKNEQTTWMVKDEYLTTLWATTGESFINNASGDDVNFGLLFRFLVINPQYSKATNPVRMRRAGETKKKVMLGELGEAFYRAFTIAKNLGPVLMVPSDYGMDKFNAWADKKQAEYEACGDDHNLPLLILARMSPMVLKLSALFALGDIELMEKFATSHPERGRDEDESTTHTVTMSKIMGFDKSSEPEIEMVIPDEYVSEAIRAVDEYFLKTSIDRFEDILSRENKNTQEGEQTRILDILKKSKGYQLSRSDLLRKSKFLSDKLTKHLDTLLESETIEMGYSGDGNGNKTLFVRLL